MDAAGDNYRFEDVWPGIAQHLENFLRSRSIDQTLREDLIQDTAVRLLQAWGGLDLSRPVDGLAVTIAMNLMRDHFRRRCNQEIVGEIPEKASDYDVEHVGMARSELQRVGRAMTKLSSDHRRVLLSEIGDGRRSIDRGVAATKMLRMRARRRLTAILETASGFVIGMNGRFRREVLSEQSAGIMAAAFVMVVTAPAAAMLPAPANAPRLVAINLGQPVQRQANESDRSPASGRSTGAADRVGRPATPPPATSTETVPQGRLRPLAVPIGDAEAAVRVKVEVNDDMAVGIGQYGGPAPVCASGVPGAPEPTTCPEEDEPGPGESDQPPS